MDEAPSRRPDAVVVIQGFEKSFGTVRASRQVEWLRRCRAILDPEPLTD